MGPSSTIHESEIPQSNAGGGEGVGGGEDTFTSVRSALHMPSNTFSPNTSFSPTAAQAAQVQLLSSPPLTSLSEEPMAHPYRGHVSRPRTEDGRFARRLPNYCWPHECTKGEPCNERRPERGKETEFREGRSKRRGAGGYKQRIRAGVGSPGQGSGVSQRQR